MSRTIFYGSKDVRAIEVRLYHVIQVKSDTSKWVTAELWNYQILLFVHGQVNGQNPLVQQRFACSKTDIFSYILRKRYIVGTH